MSDRNRKNNVTVYTDYYHKLFRGSTHRPTPAKRRPDGLQIRTNELSLHVGLDDTVFGIFSAVTGIIGDSG